PPTASPCRVGPTRDRRGTCGSLRVKPGIPAPGTWGRSLRMRSRLVVNHRRPAGPRDRASTSGAGHGRPADLLHLGRDEEGLPERVVGELRGYPLDHRPGIAVGAAGIAGARLRLAELTKGDMGLPDLGRTADLSSKLEGGGERLLG